MSAMPRRAQARPRRSSASPARTAASSNISRAESSCPVLRWICAMPSSAHTVWRASPRARASASSCSWRVATVA
ncbi:hypothetical protein SMICM17S_09678 [Streptomyces microflavus]